MTTQSMTKLNKTQLIIINNALNEAVNGQTKNRIKGYNNKDLRKLLKFISSKFEEGYMDLSNLNEKEKSAIKDSINLAVEKIEDWEFHPLIGAEKQEANELLALLYNTKD